MKSVTLKLMAATVVFAVGVTPLRLSAQAQQSQVHYKLIVLETLGGPFVNPYGGVTDRTWVTGDAALSLYQTEHAFLWRDGVMKDLGTLGGPDLVSSIGNVTKDVRGWIVGVSQTSMPDLLGEDWVGGTGFPVPQNVVVGFLWKNGVMTALPNLGGNNGSAYGVNNLGQIVGVAETSTLDPSCAPPQQLDVEAVVWGPTAGEVRMLPPLPGDVEGAAFSINDRGQIVGASGQCGPGFPFAEMTHAVLWQNGKPIYLGGLRGKFANYAAVINNRGQIIGNSDLPGDTASRAVLWENGVISDLGTLPCPPLDTCASQANDINDRGQIVGFSCNSQSCSGFLWEDGVMTDLNALLPPGTALQVVFGGGINDSGEIAVQVFDPATGNTPSALMIPDPDADTTQLDFNAVSTDSLPDHVRALLQQRMKLGPFGRSRSVIPPHSTSPNADALVSTLAGAKPSTSNAAVPQSCKVLGAACTGRFTHSNCCPGSLCGGHFTCCSKPLHGMACSSSAQCCSGVCVNGECS